MEFLTVKGLRKKFGEVEALGGLDMSVFQGEIYGFLGPNGAGKTTTLRIIMGLIQADEGTMELEGEKIGRQSRKKMGYVPERVSLYERLTVKENLTFFCKLKGYDKSEVLSIINEFNLEPISDRTVQTLSKGVKQKVGLAQTLIGDPPLLVLDEPISGLDPTVRRWVKKKMQELTGEDKTILFSSHVLSEVQEVCNRVGIISNGKMLMENTISDLTEGLELGDRVVLTAEPLDKALHFVKKVKNTNRPRIENGDIVFYCKRKNKIDILKQVMSGGYRVLDIKIQEPDLEEVFVKLMEAER
ncbi:MAG: ABC transporter ATP-binding protein [Thermoplasmata archaeon]